MQASAAFAWAQEGDVEGLQHLLENTRASDAEDPPDFPGGAGGVRRALAAACALGRSSLVRELVEKRYADVNAPTTRGYSPLHHGAMWGQLDTVRTLLDLGADLHAVTFCGERAVDVARRYCKWDCVDYLTWAEAKQTLQASIAEVRDILADPKRVQGKLSEEDKKICLNTCSAKSNWIQITTCPSIQDLEEQKKHLEDLLAPILAKLTA
ncbi:ankyrin repeat domain-containing protein 45 [Brachyhypopomus gauderio]|uniref:ankyrin repeat domain-containing protein 45 n=1 Tax=Brachyhypopomus gauderio TaxID=698409 RepID=UPI00404371EE